MLLFWVGLRNVLWNMKNFLEKSKKSTEKSYLLLQNLKIHIREHCYIENKLIEA